MSPCQAECRSQVKVKVRHHVLHALQWHAEDSKKKGGSTSVVVPGPSVSHCDIPRAILLFACLRQTACARKCKVSWRAFTCMRS